MTLYQIPTRHQRRSRTTFTFYLTILLSLLILSIPTLTSAQSPLARRRPAFTQYNGQFYVHGGIVGPSTPTGDLDVLNLTSSWPTANPAWSKLDSGSWVWHHAMVPVRSEHAAGLGDITSTKGFLLSVSGFPTPLNTFFSAYNIQTGRWTNLTTESPYIGLEGHTAVSDPATGLVYIMGGYYNVVPKVGNLMTVFDPNSGTVKSKIQATDANNMTGASAVWSSRRKTVLLFEGSRAVNTGDVKGIAMTAIPEYDTTTGQWKAFVTKGASPTPRLDACAVESEDGSKIIFFGGTTDIDTVLTSIFILDVETGEWKEGQPAPGKRQQMACAYYGGFFIVFGGTSSRNWDLDLYSNQVLVYDVGQNQWVTQYTPSAVGPAPSGTPNGSAGGGNGSSGSGSGGGGAGNTGPDSQSENTSNLGAIIGAVAGVVVLLLIVLAIYLIRRRRRLVREKAVKDTEARAAAMLASEEKQKENEPKIMTAADHYAAAQAALEEASKRLRPSTFKGAKSWISEANSNSVSDGSNSTDISKARRLSDPEVQADPTLYYQQLLLKQRQLQMLHPHLIGGLSHRSPHSCVAGGDHGNDSDSDSGSTSSNRRNSTENDGAGGKKRDLKIKTDQVWVPPQGIQELIVSPPPSSPQDWSSGGNLINTQAQKLLATGLTQKIDSWNLDLTHSARSPHAVVGGIELERISRPAILPSISVTSSVDSSSHPPPPSYTSSTHLLQPAS